MMIVLSDILSLHFHRYSNGCFIGNDSSKYDLRNKFESIGAFIGRTNRVRAETKGM